MYQVSLSSSFHFTEGRTIAQVFKLFSKSFQLLKNFKFTSFQAGHFISVITSEIHISFIFCQLTSTITSQSFKSAFWAGDSSITERIFTHWSTFSKTAQIHSKSHERDSLKSLLAFALKYSVWGSFNHFTSQSIELSTKSSDLTSSKS